MGEPAIAEDWLEIKEKKSDGFPLAKDANIFLTTNLGPMCVYEEG
jgi:hypothetical protein